MVKQEQSGNVSRFLLRNGITVIISEQHSATIAASVACFKVGTRDEPEALTGVTRLIEHALMGSTRRPVTELRSMGAVTSSDTSFETSVYSLAVPSEKVKDALAAQAELLQSFSVDSEQLGRAAPRLVEEEKWTCGISWDPSPSFGMRAALNGLKENHPSVYSMARLLNLASIGNAIIPSSLDKLRSVTQEQAGAFYRAHYRPDKLVIAVAGDVVTFNTLVQIQQLYSGLGTQGQAAGQPGKNVQAPANQRTPAVLPPRPQPSDDASKTTGAPQNTPPLASLSAAAEQTKLRYGEDRGDLNQPIVSIGYHVPGAEAKDWPVIEVLAALAGMGRASGLNRLLVDGQMAASRVESTYLPLTNAAMLVFQMWPTGDASGASIDKAESAFFREIDRLRHEVPAEGEIARARALLEKRFLDRTEDYVGNARELARAEATYGNVRAALDYRNLIRAVKAEDVQRAAATYFALSNTSVHEYEPLSAPPRTFDADSFA
ncbi:MAG TPA: pitrilysin family protein, partial [Blastocatellia bacterium]|nr:pitrilysin family protein [Blastocatellia bacterium]